MFDVFQHPQNDYTVTVRRGFNWAACLLGVFWFLAKGMGLWALFWSLLVLVLTVMSSGFLALPMWICAGFVANNMQRSYLRRHGYRYVGESDRSTPNSPAVAVAR